MEQACAGADLGRIIPTPQEISSGCGLAWCAPLEAREALLALLSKNGLASERVAIVDLY